ncbi:WGR domain-containing protein [Martelella alba]|uniref:WGR domain-containing protein n=1 Tax=Martelella alba TaxID=2590451 RepID=A0A506U1K4_9HYPH|nr:WGR domain-containing protein [Martelella alba]TPW28252.1 WGR domain-containing protein [Martelella alba]
MMIYMERIDPARRMRRFYRVTIEPTLFGEWALVREWGRIGCSGGQRLERCFSDHTAVTMARDAITAAKCRRGYVLR